MMVVFVLGCADERPAADDHSTQALSKIYPHSPDFKSEHIELLSLNTNERHEFTQAKCSGCHDSSHFKAAAFLGRGVRCGEGCHSLNEFSKMKIQHQNLPRTKSREICTTCHSQELPSKRSAFHKIPNIAGQIAAPNFVHSPAGQSCTNICHDPKATSTQSMLKIPYSSETFTIDKQDYALCFSCHDQDKLLNDKLPLKTKFRDDGEKNDIKFSKNLHRLHVLGTAATKYRGMSCSTCHDPHGSSQPHNIRTRFRMEQSEDLDLYFVRVGDYKACGSYCHYMKGYRDLPIEVGAKK